MKKIIIIVTALIFLVSLFSFSVSAKVPMSEEEREAAQDFCSSHPDVAFCDNLNVNDPPTAPEEEPTSYDPYSYLHNIPNPLPKEEETSGTDKTTKKKKSKDVENTPGPVDEDCFGVKHKYIYTPTKDGVERDEYIWDEKKRKWVHAEGSTAHLEEKCGKGRVPTNLGNGRWGCGIDREGKDETLPPKERQKKTKKEKFKEPKKPVADHEGCDGVWFEEKCFSSVNGIVDGKKYNYNCKTNPDGCIDYFNALTEKKRKEWEEKQKLEELLSFPRPNVDPKSTNGYYTDENGIRWYWQHTSCDPNIDWTSKEMCDWSLANIAAIKAYGPTSDEYRNWRREHPMPGILDVEGFWVPVGVHGKDRLPYADSQFDCEQLGGVWKGNGCEAPNPEHEREAERRASRTGVKAGGNFISQEYPSLPTAEAETRATEVTINLNLYKGWNHISSPFSSDLDLSLFEACEPLITEYDREAGAVWFLDPETKKWKADTKIRAGIGYLINVNKTCSVEVTGVISIFNQMPLKKGKDDVSETLKGVNLIPGNGLPISYMINDCVVDNILYWDQRLGKWISTGGVVDLGKSYFIKVEDDCTLQLFSQPTQTTTELSGPGFETPFG